MKLYVRSSGRRIQSNLKKPLIVIEHLEEEIGRWILAEYAHSAKITEKQIIITNLGRNASRLCEALGLPSRNCFKESIANLEGVIYSDKANVIVLDPRASKELAPSEAKKAEVLVIGGILGDHPPRGRTFKMLTSRLCPPARARNLGSKQLSIDGAVYTAKEIIDGREIGEIEFIENPVVEVDVGLTKVEVLLPYAYPTKNGKPLISDEIIRILKSGGYERVLQKS